MRLLKLVKIDEYIDALENLLDVNLRMLRIVRASAPRHHRPAPPPVCAPPPPAAGRRPPTALRARRGAPQVFMLVKIMFLAHMLACFWYFMHVLSIAGGASASWATTYEGGRPAAPETPVSEKYLYSVYWAVTTLTTVT